MIKQPICMPAGGFGGWQPPAAARTGPLWLTGCCPQASETASATRVLPNGATGNSFVNVIDYSIRSLNRREHREHFVFRFIVRCLRRSEPCAAAFAKRPVNTRQSPKTFYHSQPPWQLPAGSGRHPLLCAPLQQHLELSAFRAQGACVYGRGVPASMLMRAWTP
mgnify:CR=1 FL=1